MSTPTLFDVPADFFFDGKTYEPTRDKARLSSAMDRVCALMDDGQWRTLKSIALLADTSEAGGSARIRDRKKKRWQDALGPCTVERRYVSNGLHEYRFVKP